MAPLHHATVAPGCLGTVRQRQDVVRGPPDLGHARHHRPSPHDDGRLDLGRHPRAHDMRSSGDSLAQFIVDRHPQHPRFLIASPCSGHGFKHSAALGEALAQEVLGESHLDLSALGLNRLSAHE